MSIFLLLLGAVLVQLAAEIFYQKNWKKNLNVTVEFQGQPVYAGEKAVLTETVENRKWLLLPMVQAAFRVSRNLSFGDEENTSISDFTYKRDIFSVMSYQKIRREITFTAQKRGYYQIDRTDILTRGLLLNREYYLTKPCSTYLYVYPKMLPASGIEVPFQKIMGQVLTKQRIYEDPFTFRGIREYESGDPMNKINWKASAKTGDMMVNLQDSTSSAQVILLLDVEDETIWKYEELHEAGISLAISLAAQLLAKGISVGLLSNGKDHLTEDEILIRPGTGKGQMYKLYQNLARLDLEYPAVKYSELLTGQKKWLEESGSVLVLISRNQGRDLYEASEKMAAKGMGFLWISVLHPDMEWKVPSSGKIDRLRWEVER